MSLTNQQPLTEKLSKGKLDDYQAINANNRQLADAAKNEASSALINID